MSTLYSMNTIPAVKPVIHLSPLQLSLILGLEHVLQDAGLVLLCPYCVGSAPCDGLLTTDNHPMDLTWKLNCDCTDRRGSQRGVSPLPEGGDLLILAADALKAAKLDIRCPKVKTQCRYTPLETRRLTSHIRTECQCRVIKLLPQAKSVPPAGNPS